MSKIITFLCVAHFVMQNKKQCWESDSKELTLLCVARSHRVEQEIVMGIYEQNNNISLCRALRHAEQEAVLAKH
jgi:hypothetical protein